MSGETWAGWLHEFPSREAVEAHVAAHPPLSSAPLWATGAPWLRHHGDVTVIYLAVRDGGVRARFPNGAGWHTLEMGRFGWWRPVTPLGDPAPVVAAVADPLPYVEEWSASTRHGLYDLRCALVKIAPTCEARDQLLVDAGVDTSRVAPDHGHNGWYQALVEVVNLGRVPELVAAARRAYPKGGV